MTFLEVLRREISIKKREVRFPFDGYQRKHNCIFIHIPKTAGTSILSAMGKSGVGRCHLPWYVYFNANPIYYEKAFKFAFVRNPWDRVLSAFNYLKSGGNGLGDKHIAKALSDYTEVDDFVIRVLGEGKFRNHLLFIPQSEYVLNGEGNLAVDFLGRFESINEDFKFVAKKIGLIGVLPQINRGSGIVGDYKTWFKQDRSIEIVGDIYKQDIVKFGYSFFS